MDTGDAGIVTSGVRPYRRRSIRLPVRLHIFLRWIDADGGFHEELIETLLLSRYGGLVTCLSRPKPGDEIWLWRPDRQREAPARVVFRRLGSREGVTEVAFEFLSADNYWEMDFPREGGPWEVVEG
jgi:hypothetical protein